MNACWGVVPAAGAGRRMDAELPKQYLKIAGKRVIEYSLASLLRCSTISKVIVALNEADAHWQNVSIKDNPRINICKGGESRALSVRNALAQLQTELGANADDWVVVHDAVRPCLRAAELESLIKSTWEEPVGVILAIPINDSIKRVQRTADGMQVIDTLKRDDLWVRAVTPQLFRYQLLCDALDRALADNINIDDEAIAMQKAGHEVKVLLGDCRNIKITYQSDLDEARRYLRETRQ